MTPLRSCFLLLLTAGLLEKQTLRAQDSSSSSSGFGGSGSSAESSSSGSTEPLLPDQPFASPSPAPGSSSGGLGFGSGGSSSGSGGSSSFGTPTSSFGTPAPSSGTGSGGTDTSTSPGTAPANPFSFTTPSSSATTPPGFSGVPSTPVTPAPGTEQSTGTFGSAGFTQEDEGTTFNLPAAYGQSPQSLSSGGGQLSRPRFRHAVFLAVGYDDNILSTPQNAIGQQEVRATVINANGQEESVVLQPRVDAPRPVGSVGFRAGASSSVKVATRSTIFSLDASGSVTEYPSRPGDTLAYNANLSLAAAHRVTPRLQLSSTANVAYLSQPDAARINNPTANLGQFLTGGFKLDLSYAWQPRFSTVSSFSAGTQYYLEEAAAQNSFYELTLGTEARWLLDPRLTAVAETRVTTTQYLENDFQTSNSLFLLGGGDFIYSSRLRGSLRGGVQLRSYEVQGSSAVSPYVETAVTYAYSRTGQVVWNTRLGFEETPVAFVTTRVLRTGLAFTHAFSRRLRGNLQLSGQVRSSESTAGGVANEDYLVQADAGLEYSLTRDISLTANYTYLLSLNQQPGNDYYRNQIFLGAQYAF